eukprot:384859-Rhodomonas_salina.4
MRRANPVTRLQGERTPGTRVPPGYLVTLRPWYPGFQTPWMDREIASHSKRTSYRTNPVRGRSGTESS